MTVIAWKEVYETGVVALDNEHRGLVAEINRLYEAVRDHRADDVLDDILAMLEQYTVEHFEHEEKLMAEFKFPGLEEHQQAHRELIESVEDMKTRAATDSQELAKEMLKFLRNWVLEHIVEMDKQYGPFLESRAGRFVE